MGVRRTADSCYGLGHSSLSPSLLFTSPPAAFAPPQLKSLSVLTPTHSSLSSFCLLFFVLTPNTCSLPFALYISSLSFSFATAAFHCCLTLFSYFVFHQYSASFSFLITPIQCDVLFRVRVSSVRQTHYCLPV